MGIRRRGDARASSNNMDGARTKGPGHNRTGSHPHRQHILGITREMRATMKHRGKHKTKTTTTTTSTARGRGAQKTAGHNACAGWGGG
eukprot:6884068-Lingulodinium_polyedra.AAC.1